MNDYAAILQIAIDHTLCERDDKGNWIEQGKWWADVYAKYHEIAREIGIESK